MHIAVLSDGITPYVTGGMQRHTYHLVRHFLLLGVDVTLVHTVPNTQALPATEEVVQLFGKTPGSLAVIAIPFPRFKPIPGHYIRESYAFSTRIAEALIPLLSDFDFIYAKGFTAWNLLERKRRGLHSPPIGVKFHGYEMFQKSRKPRVILEQQLFKPAVIFNSRNANIVFSYGGEISRIIERIGVEAERIAEISSAVDSAWIASEIPRTNIPRRFVFVGRNERRKGITDLRKALDSLPAGLLEMHWVGDIPLEMIGENETRHGQITDPKALRSLLSTLDVLVAPSHSEGMPNVILEAMARGLAIIATPVGAVPQVVKAVNGILIPPHKPTAIANAMRRLAEIPANQLEAIKKQNLEDIQVKFTWKKVAAQTLEIIQRITFSAR